MLFTRNEKAILDRQRIRKKSCMMKWKQSEFRDPGDWVSVGGRCEAAATAMTRCGWIMLGNCGKLLYGKRLSLKLTESVCKSFVRTKVLYESDA